MREKCQHLEFFRPAFSRIRTQYGEITRIFLRIRPNGGNTDQKSSKYGQFSEMG